MKKLGLLLVAVFIITFSFCMPVKAEEEDDGAISKEILYSGSGPGYTWTIDSNGKLTAKDAGTGSSNFSNDGWYNYKSKIKSAYIDVGYSSHLNSLFKECTKLEKVTIKIPSTSGHASYMFSGCTKLTNVNILGLDTSNCTEFDNMFSKCSSLVTVDLSKLNTSSAKSMYYMFADCTNLKSLDLTNFDTRNVWLTAGMFDDCESLETITLGSNFSTAKVTDMSLMFSNCKKLETLSAGKFKTGKVERFDWMFRNCESLKKINVTNWDTSSAKNMSLMFYRCVQLKNLDLSNWNTENVTSMHCMFYGCEALEEIDLTGVNTSNVTDMGSLFSGCKSLTSLDVSSFRTGKVTEMNSMFSGCSELTELDLSRFNLQNYQGVDGEGWLFSACDKLRKIKSPKNLTVTVALPRKIDSTTDKWYDKTADKNVTYLPKKQETSHTLIRNNPVTNVYLSDSSISIKVGEKKTVSVTDYEPRNTTEDPTPKWTSGDVNIATVAADGKVKGVAVGKTEINCKVGSITKKITVSVYQEYNVKYDANGGINAPDAQVRTSGTNLTLRTKKPTREGYNFVNWNTKADGSGTSYEPGASYKEDKGVTLYAQWKIKKYTIVYDGNGGSNVPDKQTKEYGVDITLRSKVPTNEGYDFVSWNTKADGSGTAYEPGANYQKNEALTLYAQWKVSTYEVKYDANGGNYAPDTQIKPYGKVLALRRSKPVRTGYDFTCWNTKADGSGISYEPGEMYGENAGLTLYAQWKEKTYEVSYDANWGSNAPAPQTKTYGVDLILSSEKPTRTGYSFKGWNTKPGGGGTDYAPGGVYKENEQITLYAQWKVNSYEVSYNANGGSNAPAAQSKTFGMDLTLSSEKPIREGYKFTGWNTKADGSGTAYAAGAVYKADEKVTLYAQWGDYPFTITYNANGGIDAPKAQKKDMGQAIYLSAQIPTREAYSFVGWNTKADGSGVTYSPGAYYGLNESLDLYAKWKALSCSVSYNANGGSKAPATQEKLVDKALILSEQIPYKEGYTFVSWNTKADGSGVSYNPGATYTQNVAIVLYAQWKINTYTVRYDANGGSNAPTAQSKTYGKDLTLSSAKPTKTGYSFTGWNTKADGSGTAYAAGAVYKANEKITLYAQWKVNTYEVSYNANGGSNAPAAQSKTYGKDLTLSSAKPTRTGYSFTGWNTKADGSGTAYAAGAVYKANEKITLYAQWKVNTYEVSYNANGGSNAPAAQSKTYGKDLTLSSAKPTRTDYNFVSWNTKADGSGTSYASGATYKANEKVILYAQWKAYPFTVSYNANGGTDAPKAQKKDNGQTITLSKEIPTREAYSFTGWNTKADGSGTAYAAGASYAKDTSVTLYAQWKSLKCSVSYNANGGSKAPATQEKIVGKDLILSDQKPVREGYTFVNWNTKTDGSGTTYKPGATYTKDVAVVLYAQWKINTYEVAYNANGGNNAPAAQSKTYGKDLTLSSTKPTRTGYNFIGWNTKADGSGTAYAVRAVYKANSGLTLYAQWEKIVVEEENPFADIEKSEWKYIYAKYVYDRKIMVGKGINKNGKVVFDPDGPITRAEFVTTVYNLEGRPGVTYANCFADVDNGKYYSIPITWGYNVKLTSGYGKKFGVNDSISREQIAQMLYSYAKIKGYSLKKNESAISAYKDCKKVSAWATDAMKWAVTNGVMKGKGETLDPTGVATRAECATMIRNFCEMNK